MLKEKLRIQQYPLYSENIFISRSLFLDKFFDSPVFSYSERDQRRHWFNKRNDIFYPVALAPLGSLKNLTSLDL